MLSKTFFVLAATALLASPALATPSQVKILGPNFESEAPALKWDTPSINRIQSVRPEIASTASWYGPGFYGNRTSNGEVFRPGATTAAHRTLPFGTRVRVTNLRNGRSTVVRINDRGPFHGNRVIDLADGAASRIGMLSSGVVPVKLEVLR